MHAAYDLTPFEEPARTEGCENMDLDKEDWLEASEFSCVSKDAQIYVAYSKSLEERNPPVARVLSQRAPDPDVVNQWILKIGRDKIDPRQIAEDWVANDMDVVEDWIN